MKVAIIAAAVFGLTAAAGVVRRADDTATDGALDNDGSPIGASKWDAIPEGWYAKHPQFKIFDLPGAETGAVEMTADGAFVYPNGDGTEGKYISYACADGQPGLYWGENIQDGDKAVVAEVGEFYELKDGSYYWQWSLSNGKFGANIAPKGKIDSKCGWKKA